MHVTGMKTYTGKINQQVHHWAVDGGRNVDGGRVKRLWHVSIGFVLSHAHVVPLKSFDYVAFAVVMRLSSG